ncbi:MAG: lysophospholipid acyltransferase family protein [Bauldia sp.]
MSERSVVPTAANDAASDLSSLAIQSVARRMAPLGSSGVPTVGQVFRRRLPFARMLDRLLLRFVTLVARRQVAAISGIEHILGPQPFILALNHSIKREAVIVPALLVFHRGGRLIHFWSDWVYRLVPGLALILRRAGTIVVITKPGRPRALNALKPLFAPAKPAIEQARAHLMAHRPIGVFPEGTVNRNRRRLLPGRYGTARLSLETGVPVVPAGIVFPSAPAGSGPIPERETMEIRIGAPLTPPHYAGARPTHDEIRAWHATIMREIARLSGKTWEPIRDSGEDRDEQAAAAA